jgi:hypothetical protein
MRLKFVKGADNKICVYIYDNNEYTTFSYPLMIKEMFNDKIVEEAEIEGNFTDVEIKSIKDIIEMLKSSIIQSESSDMEFDDNNIEKTTI